MIDLQGILAAVTVVISVVALYMAWKKAPLETKKIKADIAETFEGIASRSGERIDRLEAEINELREGVKILITQLEENRIVPRWRPTEKPTIPIKAKP